MAIDIQVHYTTQLRAALGVPRETVTVEPPHTLGKLIDQLSSLHGSSFSDLVLMEQRRIQPAILICIGDEQISFDEHRELNQGDIVTILSAISGG